MLNLYKTILNIYKTSQAVGNWMCTDSVFNPKYITMAYGPFFYQKKFQFFSSDSDDSFFLGIKNGLGCNVKANCPLVEPGPAGRVIFTAALLIENGPFQFIIIFLFFFFK